MHAFRPIACAYLDRRKIAAIALVTTLLLLGCKSKQTDDEPQRQKPRPGALVHHLGDTGLFLHGGTPILGSTPSALQTSFGDTLSDSGNGLLTVTLSASPSGVAPQMMLNTRSGTVTDYWFQLEYRSDARNRDEVARALDRALGGRGRPVRRGAHECAAYPVPGMDDTPRDDSSCTPEMFACERAEVAVCHSEAMNAIHIFVERASPPNERASDRARGLDGRRWQISKAVRLPETLREPSVTVLRDGRIAFIGGIHWEPSTNDAILYDPMSHQIDVVSSEQARTRQHAAVELPDGTVLVTGGTPADVTNFHLSVARAQRFDPVRRRWMAVPPMATPRYGHSAFLLDDGRVLVFGGTQTGSEFLRSAELYDPKRNRWKSGPPLRQGRWQHAAVRLPSGRILVAGSGEPGAEMTSEVFEPDSGTWTLSGTLHRRWFGHQMVVLSDGRAWLVGESYIGGPEDEKLATLSPIIESELYDPDTSTWTLSASDARSWMSFSAISTNDGVLLVGGHRPAKPGTKPKLAQQQLETLLFSPHTEKFYVGPSLPTSHAGDWPRLVDTSDGRVLLFARDATAPLTL